MSGFLKHDKAVISGAQSSLLSQSKGRFFLVIAVFFIGYLCISLRLVDLTLLRDKSGEETAAAQQADVRVLKKPLRGTLLDRNGELMATSLKMASVYADATLVDDAVKIADELAAILPDQTVQGLAEKLISGKKFVWIARNITPRQQYAINALGHPALGFQEEDRRIYPHGNLTAHILGYTDVDGKGISGAEKSFNRELSEGEEPVRLAIDLRIQHLLHRELSEAKKTFSAKAAIGAVMDVNSGEIIALVSLPDFDPLRPAEAPDNAKFNNATLGVFEMGSTFKLFSTAAALDVGSAHFGTVFDAVTPIRFGRFTITDYHAKRRAMTLPEVFIYSSNIGTARMAQALGTEGLKEFYRALGFFAPVPVDFPEKGQPLYPKPWREISTLTTSYGHGISVTPLHLVRAAAAMVNGGILVNPKITLDKNAKSLSLAPEGERVIKPQTSAQVRQLMELVVAEGTGTKGYAEGYNVGGKTGTSNKVSGKGYDENALLSSFIGVFPIDNPRYVVAALIDEPKATKETFGYATGGWTAAPVVAKVISQMGPLYQIPPDLDTRREGVEALYGYLKEKKGGSVAANRTDR